MLDPTSGQQLERFEYAAPKMGTEFRIVFYAPDREAANAAADSAWARADSLEALFSDYRPESELNKISDAPAESWTRVSPDVLRILRLSMQYSAATGGAFDVTIGPLSRLWRHAIRRNTLPDSADVSAAKESVSYRNIVLAAHRSEVALRLDGMRLDLGGIAKGYTADAVIDVLASFGLRYALVDAGGDLAVGDAPPGEPGWRIAVTETGEAGNPTQVIRTIANCGVATSGDRYRNVEHNGIRYSHLIDPRTGWGVAHSETVTVIAPTATQADALASAYSVLGVDSRYEPPGGVEVLFARSSSCKP